MTLLHITIKLVAIICAVTVYYGFRKLLICKLRKYPFSYVIEVRNPSTNIYIRPQINTTNLIKCKTEIQTNV